MVVYHGGDRLDGGVQREERYVSGEEEKSVSAFVNPREDDIRGLDRDNNYSRAPI